MYDIHICLTLGSMRGQFRYIQQRIKPSNRKIVKNEVNFPFCADSEMRASHEEVTLGAEVG